MNQNASCCEIPCIIFICGTIIVYIISVFNYIYKAEKNIKIISQNNRFGTECAVYFNR